jgi:hypothetical protein
MIQQIIGPPTIRKKGSARMPVSVDFPLTPEVIPKTMLRENQMKKPTKQHANPMRNSFITQSPAQVFSKDTCLDL